jgi:DNA polymerase elongation subunit (family B)
VSKFYTFVGQRRDNGGEVLHTYYDEKGVRHEDAIKYQPLLGKRVSKPDPDKEYFYHDIHGNPLQSKRFKSIDLYRHFMDEYDEVDFYGCIKEDYQFLGEEYPGEIEYDPAMVRAYWIDIETKMIWGKDWAEIHDQPITSISLMDRQSGKIYVMSTKSWAASKTTLTEADKVDLSTVKFKQCKDEEGLFKHLRAILHHEKPDMLIGFNSDYFDMPYIIKRGTYVMGKEFMKGFSPWKHVTSKKKVDKDTGEIYDYYNTIQGIPLMDYMKMYKKFVLKPRDSYGLEALANVELGAHKLDHSEYKDLDDMWDKNPQKYIDYNIVDVVLMDRMEDKLGLINLVCTVAYYSKVNFTDSLGTVGKWDALIFNKLKDRNIMIPPKLNSLKEKFKGGYVFVPEPRVHNWLIAVDLKSLYPHIQQEWNISPDTLVGDMMAELDIDITKDLDDRWLNQEIKTPESSIMAMNGCFFNKEREGIIPGILRDIYADRTKAKNKMLDFKADLQEWKEKNGIGNKEKLNDFDGNEDAKIVWTQFESKITALDTYQSGMKILMNSEYGALANIHFRYYDIRLASAVTQCAQMALRWAAKRLMADPAQKKYKYTLVYGDTDSLYISVENVVEQIKMRKPGITDGELVKQANGFVAKILQPIIKQAYADLAAYVNANENRMFMSHEKTIRNGLWVAKKHYAMNVLWDEGTTYAEPKLKVKGIAVVKSSTPKVIRESLKEAVAILLRDEVELSKFVREQKRKFKDYTINEIAFPRTANNIEKWQKENLDGSLTHTKGTPIGVRAAIVYNNSIRDQKGAPLRSGEKIRFVYLRTPNHYDQNVIGYMQTLPEAAIKYVDYDLMFQKAFMACINNIYQKMGKEFRLYDEVNLLDIF